MPIIEVRSQPELDSALASCAATDRIELHGHGPFRVRDDNFVAYDDAVVSCYGKSWVRAMNRSRISAYDQSQVEASDNSSVDAHDQSRVEAWCDSRVRLFDASDVSVHSSDCTVIDLRNR